ncbi:aldo/keto reductase [Brevundimonas sp. Root1279]|uniref:aldo/keto reductase n=1 Tax=Brevundimonas sp. Root1279 TaxID=1736443 RepID=UPI0006F9AD3A|nr:aldo/keto reductase [Brevundimonas sp. Root1279]KQW80790.1 pyridoxal 4-dehydrogenase [Brevundimonas sp. Root1279]
MKIESGDNGGVPGRRAVAGLTPLGFGGAAIGNLYRPVTDVEALEAVTAAWDVGVRYFDTAPHYGFGLGEERMGAALKALDPRGEAVVSTKVGRLLQPVADAARERHGFVEAAAFEPVFDYSHDGVLRSFEASLKRLQRDRIDILFAHDLGAATHGAAHPERWAEFIGGGYRAMRRLRDEGVVGAIGLGANEWQVCEQALAEGEFDAFLLAGRYTLLEQTSLDSFLPLCAERGASVIVGGPFNSGVLACAVPSDDAHYDYAAPPAWVVDKVDALRAACAAWSLELPAAALQFPLAHPQVVSVIPGVADADEARAAAARIAAPIPPGFWQDLMRRGLIHPASPLPQAEAAA